MAQRVHVTVDGEHVTVTERRKQQDMKRAAQGKLLKRRQKVAQMRHRDASSEQKKFKCKGPHGYNFSPSVSFHSLEPSVMITRQEVRHSARVREYRRLHKDSPLDIVTELRTLAKDVREVEETNFGRWRTLRLPAITSSTRPVLTSRVLQTTITGRESEEDEGACADQDEGKTGEAEDLTPLVFRTRLPPLLTRSIREMSLTDLVFADDVTGLKELLQIKLNDGTLSTADVNSALLLAITRGQPRVADVLLRSGAEPEFCNEYNPLIVQAALTNLTESVNLLLRFGCSPNATKGSQCTPLHFACRRGNLEMVKALVRGGADLQAAASDGVTPLHWAVASGKRICTKYLLSKYSGNANARDDKGRTPLHEAARLGQTRVIQVLRQHGAQVVVGDDDGWTPLALAVQGHHTAATVALLIPEDIDERESTTGYTLLMRSAQCGHAATVKLLLEKNSDAKLVAPDGMTSIGQAIKRNHRDIIKVLAAESEMKQPCCNEMTPLQFFADQDKANDEEFAEIMTLFVTQGADVNKAYESTDNPTPLITFMGTKSAVKIMCLLELGADPNVLMSDPTRAGETCLWLAVSRHRPYSLVADLIEANFDMRLSGRAYGHAKKTPLHVALSNRSLHAVQTLLSAGCSPHNLDLSEFLPAGETPSSTLSNIASLNPNTTRSPSSEEPNDKAFKELVDVLKDKTRSARQLQDLCKLTIKSTLGHGVFVEEKILTLPLPGVLRDYLSCRHVDAMFRTDDWLEALEALDE